MTRTKRQTRPKPINEIWWIGVLNGITRWDTLQVRKCDVVDLLKNYGCTGPDWRIAKLIVKEAA